MITGGSGDLNLSPKVHNDEDDIEEMLSRMRSLLVFTVESKGPRNTNGGRKSEVMIERWKNIFSKYDREGTGTLNIDNIKHMVRLDLKIAERLVSDAQIQTLFAAIDEDGGGTVEFNEFLDFVQKPSTKGTLSEEEVVDSVARGVRLALRRNKIRISELEANFYSFDESGDVATGELGLNDMVRFFRKVLKLSKHECSDKALRTAFWSMDEDGSGSMSLDELMDFIKFCNEDRGQKTAPGRVPGLIGGMRGELPARIPSRRPGSFRESPMSHMPFCLNGRDIASSGRLASTQGFLARADSEPNFAARTSSNFMLPAIPGGGGDSARAESVAGMTSSRTGLSQETNSSKPKRVWSGKLPGRVRGGYCLLKGARSLNHVEDRLFEAGIDVRGHYHKIGRDRYF